MAKLCAKQRREAATTPVTVEVAKALSLNKKKKEKKNKTKPEQEVEITVPLDTKLPGGVTLAAYMKRNALSYQEAVRIYQCIHRLCRGRNAAARAYKASPQGSQAKTAS